MGKKTDCKVYSLLDVREIRIKKREIMISKKIKDSLELIDAKLQIIESNICPQNENP